MHYNTVAASHVTKVPLASGGLYKALLDRLTWKQLPNLSNSTVIGHYYPSNSHYH